LRCGTRPHPLSRGCPLQRAPSFLVGRRRQPALQRRSSASATSARRSTRGLHFRSVRDRPRGPREAADRRPHSGGSGAGPPCEPRRVSRGAVLTGPRSPVDLDILSAVARVGLFAGAAWLARATRCPRCGARAVRFDLARPRPLRGRRLGVQALPGRPLTGRPAGDCRLIVWAVSGRKRLTCPMDSGSDPG
jgi:hypothetical protein